MMSLMSVPFWSLPTMLRGETIQKPDRVEPEYIGIPRDFYELHKFITSTTDVMFVDGIAFLITLSQDAYL